MSDTPAVPASPPRHTFIEFLQQLEDGRFIANCTAESQTMIREMTSLHAAGIGKTAGKIRIELVVKNDGGVFDVTGEIKTVMPRRPRTRSIMYATRDGALTAVNPYQQELPLRDVGVAEGKHLRSV